jgi:signal transduction histidine kinase
MPEPKEQIVSAIVKARAELEVALLELEKLPAISQSSVFFAAHALSNFLTVTGGTVELLSLSLEGHPDPKVHTGLVALQQATNLMAHTVGRLMNASSDKDVALRFETVALPVMVKHFCTYYDRVADRKQIRCRFEPALDVPSVWTDRVAAAAVLDNLFSNAVKYSPPNTRIWVDVFADRDGVVCSVRDEGPGLSEEDKAKLFQPGARLTPKPTGGEPSSGYGLAVAKELIERLGGSIWCESVLGEGTRFSFRLPRYQEAVHGAVEQSPSLPDKGVDHGDSKK